MGYKHGCTSLDKRVSTNQEWRAYHCWLRLRNRCDNPKSKDYINYGARGITYDLRWKVFANFLADMGTPPEGLSIERIDNDGAYCKENCKWANRLEQSRNRRNKRLIEYDGKRMRISEWAEYLGVPTTTVKNRFYRGWPLNEVLKS